MALAYKKIALAEDTQKGRIDLDDGSSQEFLVLGTGAKDGSVLTLMCRAASVLSLIYEENDSETVIEVLSMASGSVYHCYFNKASGGELDVDVYSPSGLSSVTGTGTYLRLTGGQTEYILFR